uniref:Secreted protein n=1 Tax=Steinernema glaseri TaxID=37863 RepID=A0A1I8AQX7_9BILA
MSRHLTCRIALVRILSRALHFLNLWELIGFSFLAFLLKFIDSKPLLTRGAVDISPVHGFSQTKRALKTKRSDTEAPRHFQGQQRADRLLTPGQTRMRVLLCLCLLPTVFLEFWSRDDIPDH